MPDELVPPAPRLLAALGWAGGLLAVLGAALALGDVPALAAPPLARPGGLAAWASQRTPLEAAFAILRIAVVALAGYLLAVTAIAVAHRLGRAGRLVTALDVVTLPWVRAVVHGTLGVGLAGATLAGVGAAAGSRAADPPTVLTAGQAAPAQAGAATLATGDLLVRLPEPDAVAPTMARLVATEGAQPPRADGRPVTPAEGDEGEPATPVEGDEVADAAAGAGAGELVAPVDGVEAAAAGEAAGAEADEGDGGHTGEGPRGGGSSSSVPVEHERGTPPSPASSPEVVTDGSEAAAAPSPAPPVVGAAVELAAGDHLWAVAERALTEGRGEAPTDAEVTAYWRAVVDANQDRLADPANPDLVFPGQVLFLPDLPVP